MGFVFLLILIAPFLSYGADHYNSGKWTWVESPTHVTFTWTFTASSDSTGVGDSTGSYHSRPLPISGLAVEPAAIYSNTLITADTVDSINYAYKARIWAVSNTANSDWNLLYHYSLNNSNWVVQSADTDVDAVSNTLKRDSLGVINKTRDDYFFTTNYLVIEADGQASNPAAQILTVILRLPKEYPGIDMIAPSDLQIATGGTP